MDGTNYTGTFIQVADDCPTEAAELPPVGGKAPTVAALQYALISEHPYEYTSDDVLFEVYATRQAIPAAGRADARQAFFVKDQACLRSSPLGNGTGGAATTIPTAASLSCRSAPRSTRLSPPTPR